MSSLVEKHAPIDAEIADALIIATPESWRQADMSVSRSQDGELEEMKIAISSPEGHSDVVFPTEEIYTGLYKLSDVFRAHGAIWSEAHYSVEMTDDGDWKYTVRFGYSDQG